MKFRKLIVTVLIGISLCTVILPISNQTDIRVFAVTTEKSMENLDSSFIDEQKYSQVGEERSVGNVARAVIKVVKNGTVKGFVYSIVVGGIIKAVTGKSGEDWVSEAIVALVNQPYSKYNGIIDLRNNINWGGFTCPGIIIDHSGRCK